MKFFFIVFFLFLLHFNPVAQTICEELEIISIYDFPPSPSTPGGNYFLMLLALKNDALVQFNPFYADFYFENEQGDTISIPFGPSVTLPENAGDTIPYIMKLKTELNNQDFPKDFRGSLVIKMADLSVCEIPYSNVVANVLMNQASQFLKVFPNPFSKQISVQTEQSVVQWSLFNILGNRIDGQSLNSKNVVVDLSHIPSGKYFLKLQLKNGLIHHKKILKTNY